MSSIRTYLTPLLAGSFLLLLFGCRSTTGVHVWAPGKVTAPAQAKIAVAPMAGNRLLAERIEHQLLAQRPAAKSDVQLFTADQLASRSPVQLASTASLNTDLTAIQAARAVGADLLFQGEIISAKLDPDSQLEAPDQSEINYNELFFQRAEKASKQESLVLGWRIIDTKSGATLGTHLYTLGTEGAKKLYPDLDAQLPEDTDVLIAASAREAWQALAPIVVKEDIKLSSPWFQPGAIGVQLGVRAAKKGRWQDAERHWTRVARWFPYSASAQHNLAVAKGAREDFQAAKLQLQKARGIFAWNLPGETLFWLDQKHRDYNEAHGLGDPKDGWAFPQPIRSPAQELLTAPTSDIEDLPWWSAIPFAKPQGWTWRAWLTQPVIL
ncbi:MAG: hypothetical protein AAF483_11735 [Planctomycetota bacterium]